MLSALLLWGLGAVIFNVCTGRGSLVYPSVAVVHTRVSPLLLINRHAGNRG